MGVAWVGVRWSAMVPPVFALPVRNWLGGLTVPVATDSLGRSRALRAGLHHLEQHQRSASEVLRFRV
jgi:hypothetical protein